MRSAGCRRSSSRKRLSAQPPLGGAAPTVAFRPEQRWSLRRGQLSCERWIAAFRWITTSKHGNWARPATT